MMMSTPGFYNLTSFLAENGTYLNAVLYGQVNSTNLALPFTILTMVADADVEDAVTVEGTLLVEYDASTTREGAESVYGSVLDDLAKEWDLNTSGSGALEVLLGEGATLQNAVLFVDSVEKMDYNYCVKHYPPEKDIFAHNICLDNLDIWFYDV
jgi:hypothetical protein